MARSTRERASGLSALVVAAVFAVVVAACGSSASTAVSGTLGPAGATPSQHGTAAASTVAVSSAAVSPSAAETQPSVDPVLTHVSDALAGLTSYRFKFTLKGGSYASSVGTGGVVGTVINSPSFAVQFTYVDLEIIEINGKNWTKNGTSWDLSLYPDSPTTYDSYGPAILFSHYFTASSAAAYTAAGDETVNGVLATRYTAAPQSLNYMMGYWGIKPGATMAADIWIAKSGGYPVRWHVTGTGTDNFDFLIDITKANDAGNVINVPAS
jgi:hypothetical protein